MNKETQPSLTVFYQLPENMSLEEAIMDLADQYAKELLYPFQSTTQNVISVQFVFSCEKDLLDFKKAVVDIAFKKGVYIHFGP